MSYKIQAVFVVQGHAICVTQPSKVLAGWIRKTSKSLVSRIHKYSSLKSKTSEIYRPRIELFFLCFSTLTVVISGGTVSSHEMISGRCCREGCGLRTKGDSASWQHGETERAEEQKTVKNYEGNEWDRAPEAEQNAS